MVRSWSDDKRNINRDCPLGVPRQDGYPPKFRKPDSTLTAGYCHFDDRIPGFISISSEYPGISACLPGTRVSGYPGTRKHFDVHMFVLVVCRDH